MNPRPQNESACRHRLLARGESHQITLCSCGSVHLTVRNLTLRLSPEEFSTLASSVSQAAGGLVQDPEPVSADWLN